MASEAAIRDLIATINRLCDIVDGHKRTVPINGVKRHPKDPTAAERARRYRDKVKYRAANGRRFPENFGIIPLD